MDAASYVPKFRDDVVVSVGGRDQAVAPKQCLTETSAKELVEVLNGNGYTCDLVRDASGDIIGHPITYKGGLAKNSDGEWEWDGHGAASSAMAPHIVLSDGTILNAGLVADYWVHNPPNPGDVTVVALRNAKTEIEGERANQGNV